MTKRSDIRVWLDQAKEMGAAYVIVVWDHWDDFPVHVFPHQSARVVSEIYTKRGCTIMECYDLAMDWEAQLAEHRALHWPDPERSELVVIWSGEHSAYWRDKGCGYVQELLGAGVYTRAYAEQRTSGCGPEKMIELRPVNLSDVRRQFLDQDTVIGMLLRGA